MVDLTQSQKFAAAAQPAHDLTQQLRGVHDLIRSKFPFVDRVALALYEASTDLLKTFVSSNSDDQQGLKAYEIELAKVPSLKALAQSHQSRMVDSIPLSFNAPSTHTSWLVGEGYQASYTVPIFQGQKLAAFLFFDSRQAGAFNAEVTRFLDVFSDLIAQLYLLQRQVVDGIVGTIQIAVGLAKIRDSETGEHLERMSHYSRLMARTLADKYDLSDEMVEYIYLFAPLHDIGKVGIPDRILLKPGRLDPEETKIMHTHVEIGEKIIERIGAEMSSHSSMPAQVMRNIVSMHHERGDGSGYPRGLKFDQIPIEGRIVAVADVYDSLSFHRPYKPMWMEDAVMEQLRREAKLGQLCADCVDALAAHPEARLAIKERFAERNRP